MTSGLIPTQTTVVETHGRQVCAAGFISTALGLHALLACLLAVTVWPSLSRSSRPHTRRKGVTIALSPSLCLDCFSMPLLPRRFHPLMCQSGYISLLSIQHAFSFTISLIVKT